jgi:hypothetical protein
MHKLVPYEDKFLMLDEEHGLCLGQDSEWKPYSRMLTEKVLFSNMKDAFKAHTRWKVRYTSLIESHYPWRRTPDGNKLYREIVEVVQPIYKKYSDRGCSTRDIQKIIEHAIESLSHE